MGVAMGTTALVAPIEVLVADTVGGISKIAVARPRLTGGGTGSFDLYSFPSGHTGAAAALATGAYLVWRVGRPGRERFQGAMFVATAGGAVAAGRVVVDAHRASDVHAAATGSVASALITRLALGCSISPDVMLTVGGEPAAKPSEPPPRPSDAHRAKRSRVRAADCLSAPPLAAAECW